MDKIKNLKIINIAISFISFVLAIGTFFSLVNIDYKLEDVVINHTPAHLLISGIILCAIANIILMVNKTDKLSEELNKLNEANAKLKEELFEEEIQEEGETIEADGTETYDLNEDDIFPEYKNSLEQFNNEILSRLSKYLEIVQGMIYNLNETENVFKLNGKYAYVEENGITEFKEGETLPGQTVKDKKVMNISNLADDYIKAYSGLGGSAPKNLIMVPVLHEDKVVALFELSAFKKFSDKQQQLLTDIAENYALKIEKIKTV